MDVSSPFLYPFYKISKDTKKETPTLLHETFPNILTPIGICSTDHLFRPTDLGLKRFGLEAGHHLKHNLVALRGFGNGA